MNPKSNPEMSTVPDNKTSVFLNWGEEFAKEMSGAQADKYKRFCEDRAARWKEDLAEDIKIRDLFLEAGRKAFEEAGKSKESLSPIEADKKDK